MKISARLLIKLSKLPCSELFFFSMIVIDITVQGLDAKNNYITRTSDTQTRSFAHSCAGAVDDAIHANRDLGTSATNCISADSK